MQPLAIDPRILRTLLAPEIKVVPGRALMARVVQADGSGRGSLSIAGFLLEAELPPDVRTGQDLRLIVRDVSPDRVLLSLSEQHQPAPAPPPATPPPPPPAVPLPGGGSLQVTERDAAAASAGGSPRPHTVALRYDAPALGAVDLRFALDPSTMTLAVTVAPGSLDAARAAAEDLRRTLADSLGRSVSVTV
ncbi:MAG TPA: hypothetical protein VE127_05700, partial [Solirubrobacteraceae bacterium]|nr:hypothetical protein [Solirubrobacteraceae bacterium]